MGRSIVEDNAQNVTPKVSERQQTSTLSTVEVSEMNLTSNVSVVASPVVDTTSVSSVPSSSLVAPVVSAPVNGQQNGVEAPAQEGATPVDVAVPSFPNAVELHSGEVKPKSIWCGMFCCS